MSGVKLIGIKELPTALNKHAILVIFLRILIHQYCLADSWLVTVSTTKFKQDMYYV